MRRLQEEEKEKEKENANDDYITVLLWNPSFTIMWSEFISDICTCFCVTLWSKQRRNFIVHPVKEINKRLSTDL
jgi:ribonuclease I